jgi:type II secretory pathway pseudopilin PulG
MWANKKNNTGFTIVETLIVLAVSSAMFFSIAALVSGQVTRNQSRQAANSIEIYVRDALNDVSTGYYPETGANFTCSDTGGAAPSVSNGGAITRGSNATCVFAGKKITFKANEIDIDTVVALAKVPTITAPNNQLKVVDGLRETKPYPYSVRRTAGTDRVYYVLNKLISPTTAQETSFISGSQAVSVVKPDNTTNATGFIVCFDNNARLTLGAGGSADAKIEQGVASCAETI